MLIPDTHNEIHVFGSKRKSPCATEFEPNFMAYLKVSLKQVVVWAHIAQPVNSRTAFSTLLSSRCALTHTWEALLSQSILMLL